MKPCFDACVKHAHTSCSIYKLPRHAINICCVDVPLNSNKKTNYAPSHFRKSGQCCVSTCLSRPRVVDLKIKDRNMYVCVEHEWWTWKKGRALLCLRQARVGDLKERPSAFMFASSTSGGNYSLLIKIIGSNIENTSLDLKLLYFCQFIVDKKLGLQFALFFLTGPPLVLDININVFGFLLGPPLVLDLKIKDRNMHLCVEHEWWTWKKDRAHLCVCRARVGDLKESPKHLCSCRARVADLKENRIHLYLCRAQVGEQ